MPTLEEYFWKDGGRCLSTHKIFTITVQDQKKRSLPSTIEVIGRLHLDFESNAKYISYFIPESSALSCPSRVVLNYTDEVLALEKNIHVEKALPGEKRMLISELHFSGRIFVYSEDPIAAEDMDYIRKRSKKLGQNIKFRLKEYAEKRSEWEHPIAFISHDSRDKEEIAKPLALELQIMMYPVWYDEFSLKVGDSLRNSIEVGLKECKKCIFILTPNFLRNGGWPKREYDSIFTRELVEEQNVILPVWHNVQLKDIYEYSPVLADRKAVLWEEGVKAVARKIIAAIRTY